MAYLSQVATNYKAVPGGYTLYPPTSSRYYSGGLWDSIPTYPRTFEGWPDRTGQLTPAQLAALALRSYRFCADAKVIGNETASLELEVYSLSGEEETPITAHPLEQVWKRPNTVMSGAFVRSFWVWNMLLWGEAYLYFAPEVATNSDGAILEIGPISELWPLSSNRVKPLIDRERGVYGYEYRAGNDVGQKPVTLSPQYVSFSRYPNPYDPFRGLPPLTYAITGIQTDLSMARSNLSFFDDGAAVPVAVARLKGGMSDEDFVRIKDDLHSNFGRGQHRLLVTRADDIQVEPVSFSAKELLIVDQRRLEGEITDIALGLPPGYWDSKANRANSEHGDSVVQNAVVWPLAVMLAEDVTSQIVSENYGPQIEARFKDIRARNVELELKEKDSKKFHSTIDELRAADDMPPIGDSRGNLFLSELGKQEQAAALTTPPPTDSAPSASAPDAAAQLARELAAEKSADSLPENIAALARKMTENQIPRCEHGFSNRCRICGIERVRDFEMDDDGEPQWAIRWKPIGGPLADTSADAERAEELRRWKDKATKRMKDGRGVDFEFRSSLIAPDESERIRAALKNCNTVADVRGVFELAGANSEGISVAPNGKPRDELLREVVEELRALRELAK